MNGKRKPGAMYFAKVARFGPDCSMLTGHYYALEDTDDLRTTVVRVKQGKWASADNIQGLVVAVHVESTSERIVWYLERNRVLVKYTLPKQFIREEIGTSRNGFFWDLRHIGQHWYICGMRHQVYRLEGKRWRAMDDGIYVPAGDPGDSWLHSIDGSGDDDLYAAGKGGVIFHFDGKEWESLESPTDRGFVKVLSLGSDRVYLAGYGGALYVGSVDGWRELHPMTEGMIFWDLAQFRGKVYACTKSTLFTIAPNGDLEEVSIPVEGPLAFGAMDADEDELWTVGEECVLQFDGKKWKQHICPENV